MVLDKQAMAALFESFLAESEEGLASAEEGLLVLERNPENASALGSVFRAVHTIKGNAAIFDLDPITELAHAVEDLLDRLRGGDTVVSNGLITLLLESVDALRLLLHEKDRALLPAERDLIERLRRADLLPARSVGSASVRSGPAASRTLRIDMARLDRLLDLSGEMGIARGRLSELLADPAASVRVALEAQRDADHLHLEMQELIMKLRMVPVGPAFRQFQRIVRDTARSLGKEAELLIEGDDVEVDVTVVDHLRDPLMHMIRNAVCHGIESPEVRRRKGKPAAGTLVLRSDREAGSIVIELTDDGAGIDRERVLSRARQHGLTGDGESPNAAQIHELIFHPGLSTAEAITDLSGRGVGLDVVRRNIDAIQGSVRVESEPGLGTTFRVRLPLTLAIVDGLGVAVAGETFVVPMEAVVEALSFPRSAETEGATGVLGYRGESIPFLRLRDRLSVSGAAAERENVVVVRYGRGLAGLVVDELHGQCHTVVKPLPPSLRGISGLSGSAILPSGRIAFIVDIPGLLQVEIDRRRPSLRPQTRSTQEWPCSGN